MARLLRFTFLFVLFTGAISAQTGTLDAALQGLVQEAGAKYVAPVITGFGTNLNSGWVHRAVQAKTFGFDLEVGVVAMGTMFKDENKLFSVSAPFIFSASQANTMANQIAPSASASQKAQISAAIQAKTFTATVSGPTIVGAKADYVKSSVVASSIVVNGTTYNIPATVYQTSANGVLDGMKALPMAAPQLTFGTIYGTTLSLRYLPSVKINDDLGEFKYMGWGLQHNIAQWIPIPIPVELSAAFFTQKMDVGSFFSTTATTYGLYASKKFGWGALSLTPYAGFALESSSVDVSYTYLSPTGAKLPIKFSLDGENKSRLTVGASLKLLLFNINADYNVATYNSFSAGFSFFF